MTQKKRVSRSYFGGWQSTWCPQNDHDDDQSTQLGWYTISPLTRTDLITKNLESLNFYSFDEKSAPKWKTKELIRKATLCSQKISKKLPKYSAKSDNHRSVKICRYGRWSQVGYVDHKKGSTLLFSCKSEVLIAGFPECPSQVRCCKKLLKILPIGSRNQDTKISKTSCYGSDTMKVVWNSYGKREFWENSNDPLLRVGPFYNNSIHYIWQVQSLD